VRNIRVVEARQDLCFAFESREPVGVSRNIGRQQLEGDLATELGVFGQPHLTHPALTELGSDFEIG